MPEPVPLARCRSSWSHVTPCRFSVPLENVTICSTVVAGDVMKKQLLSTLIILVCAAAISGQAPAVKVKLRAVLVDSQLNQKSVPFLVVDQKRNGFLIQLA